MRKIPPGVAGFGDGRGMGCGMKVGKDNDTDSLPEPQEVEPCLHLDG